MDYLTRIFKFSSKNSPQKLGLCLAAGFLFLDAFAPSLFAQNLKEADGLFEKRLYSNAQSVYIKVFENSKDSDIKWKAFYRDVECSALLFKYGEAAQKLKVLPQAAEAKHKLRLLFLRAEILTNFSKQYSGIRSSGIIEGEEKGDIFKFTADELKDEISKTYQELFDYKDSLVAMPLKNEGYFFDIKGADFEVYPTMFDYLILRWVDYILQNLLTVGGKSMPQEILSYDFKGDIDFNAHPLYLAAGLLSYAENFNTGKRLTASEYNKAQRIMLADHVRMLDDTIKRKQLSLLLECNHRFKSKSSKAFAGYNAAIIYRRLEELISAVDICKKIESYIPTPIYSKLAAVLRAEIQAPRLNMREVHAKHTALKSTCEISAVNLDTVYFRVYKVEIDKLKEELSALHKYKYSYSHALNSVDERWLKAFISKSNPYKKFGVQTGGKNDHKETTKTVELPQLDEGVYLLTVCSKAGFEFGNSLISSCFINISNFMIAATGGVTTKSLTGYRDYLDNNSAPVKDDEIVRIYSLDLKTGRPKTATSIKYSEKNGEYNTNIPTDAKGQAGITRKINFTSNPRNYNNFDLIAKNKNSFAYMSSEIYFDYNPEPPIEIIIQTDRPIYRPGDKVQLKAVVTRKSSGGYKAVNGKKIAVSATDSNYKEFFNQQIQLNEFGSAEASFILPTGRLLGRHTIQADYNDGRFRGRESAYFSVEEYKRPEFEISMRGAESEWRYGEEVSVKGDIKYYFGSAVSNAPVKYIIKRRRFIPWHYSYLRFNSRDYHNEFTAGAVATDESGCFTIKFTPEAEASYSDCIPDITDFIVEVEARDAGGRTITASRSYLAGKDAFYHAIKTSKGFFNKNEKPAFTISRLTANGSSVRGEGSYEIHKLKDIEPSGNIQESQPLDSQLKDVPNGAKASAGKIQFGADGNSRLISDKLAAGGYRLTVFSSDKLGNEVKQHKIFVVAGADSEPVPLKAKAVTLSEKDEYQPGEKAKFIIGSSMGGGAYIVEVWAGQYLAKSIIIDNNKPVQLLEITVSDELKGGFTLRWFGVKDSIYFAGELNVSVPMSDKKLTVEFKGFKDKIEPGERCDWSISVRDSKHKPVRSESLILMYDRSLEYYSTGESRWLDALYGARISRLTDYNSLFEPRVNYQGITPNWLAQFKNPPELPKKPGIRSWQSRPTGGMKHKVELDKVYEYDTTASIFTNKQPAESKAEVTATRTPNQEVAVRKSFADTAFFYPRITSSADGTANFSFTAPEQLTGWRVKAFSFTEDIKEGSITRETATHKELMARVDIPRFFREKDKGSITAIIHNESGRTLKGSASIEVSENGYVLNDKIKILQPAKKIKIPPKSQSSIDWEVVIPQGVGTYNVRVSAVAGGLSDSEERELPILSSRQRLIESAITSISGSEKQKLQIKLKDDPTRINESAVLQVEPQLFLTILNSMPFLIEYPYSCVEQTLNKFVPLAITDKIYSNFPELKKQASKIPKRLSPTPPWDKQDPKRLIQLAETPWVYQSEGRPTSWPILDMLDPEVVKSQTTSKLEILKSAQNYDGGFPWWPGGKSDPYITLYVLAGLAEAESFGVHLPNNAVNNALKYCNQEIPKLLKPEPYHLSLVSYACYVLTSYSSEEYTSARSGYESAKSWVVYLQKNIGALTAVGKAYLAHTYIRLGDTVKANETLDMAMDGFQEDPISGVYWAPEKYSWLWYSDTIEKHAFIIRTLTALRPEDKRIKGLIQWLLFNRKGNVWKSTKASAAAIYALVDYMNKSGALTADEHFNIKWGEISDSKVVKAADWLEKPISYAKHGVEILPDMYAASIEKKGPGFAFASLTLTYSTDILPEASSVGMITLDRKFYNRVKEGGGYRLKQLNSNDKISVGDQIEVHLKFNTRSQFEYMHLKDSKPAGFESETLLSGWKYDPLAFYEEPRDSLTNFFIDYLPHGEFTVKYRLKPSKPGTYRVGAAQLQSMYAPEMTAHSAGFIINVDK